MKILHKNPAARHFLPNDGSHLKGILNLSPDQVDVLYQFVCELPALGLQPRPQNKNSEIQPNTIYAKKPSAGSNKMGASCTSHMKTLSSSCTARSNALARMMVPLSPCAPCLLPPDEVEESSSLSRAALVQQALATAMLEINSHL